MHGVGYELGTVVKAHVLRRPVWEEQAIQDIDDADAAIDFDRDGFAGELVDHVQQFMVRPSAAVSRTECSSPR